MSVKSIPQEDDQRDEPVRTGAYLVRRHSPARDAAHEQAALSLLEEITALLQSNEPNEGAILRELVGILSDIGFQCAVDVEQHAMARARYSVGTRGARLDALLDRQVERALLEGGPIWCSREPMSQPVGVIRSRTRDVWSLRELAALSLEWVLCVSMGSVDRTLGTLTVYASLDDGEFPSIALVRNIAQLVGIALANRRHHAAMLAAVERRDVAMATVAHDLKNPLSVILMTTKLMRAGIERPLSVDTIERHANYMLLLVHDILESAVMSSTHFVLHPSPCSARELVDETLASVKPLASGKMLRLQGDVAKSVDRVLVDADRIMQVLLNLVGNAVKFTPKEGSITIGAHNAESGVAFSVLDSGPGLAPEQVDHVFERFWQAESSNTGTGLGLTIARDIVEAHGGSIWVESEVGRGAKFVFTVPRAPAP